jgi:hypothetical protein
MAIFKHVIIMTLLLIPGGNADAYMPDEGNVNAIIGPFFSKTDFSGSNTGAHSPVLQNGGLIAQGDVTSKGSVEIAIFYMNKYFIRELGGQYKTEETDLFHITMGYRHWFLESFSGSLAFFSSYTVLDVSTIHNDFPAGVDVDTSARDITEYGFDFSLQYEFWTHGRFGVVVDGRYSYSVTKKDSEYSNHFGALVGLRYLISKREEVKIAPPPR